MASSLKKRDGIETPERLKRWPKLRKRFDRVQVFSANRALWWGEDGDTTRLRDRALVMTLEEAFEAFDDSEIALLELEFHAILPPSFRCEMCKGDHCLGEAIEIFQREERASIALLQVELRIGYSHALLMMRSLRAKRVIDFEDGSPIHATLL